MFFPHEATMHASVDIAAAPERVFSYMTDHQYAKRWQPDLVELQPPPEGGLRVGAVVRATVEEYGRRFDVEMRVTALAMNEHVAYYMEAPTASIHSEFRLVPQGNSTRVEHTAVVKPKAFGRFLLPLAHGMLRRKLQSRLKLLREAVEAEQ